MERVYEELNKRKGSEIYERRKYIALIPNYLGTGQEDDDE